MIKEALKTLTPEDYKLIKMAFNNEEQCIIKLPGNKFVAVNLISVSDYKIIENIGVWYYGTIS